MVEPKYKRVLIKLSGEALAGERGVGIDLPTVQTMAKEIAEVAESGVQIALVIGGGNLWRGEPAAEAGMDRVQADYTGMLGTVMNALVMADSLKQLGGSVLDAVAAAEREGADVIGVVAIFTYELPKSEKNFADAGVKLVTLSNYSELIKVAKVQGYITADGLNLLRKFKENQETWQD